MPTKMLYTLAIQFRKEALWKRLSDDALFAVPLPDGTVAYCCVMGMLGEHFALAVYPGDAGLASYRDMARHADDRIPLKRLEHLVSQDCAAVSYTVKHDIPPRSLSEMKGYGLSFHGKNAFPLIERMRPGYCPWYLDDPADDAMLSAALRAGLEVSRKLGTGGWQSTSLFDSPDDGDPPAAFEFTGGPPYDRSIPLIAENADGSFTWSKTPLPEPVAPVFPSPTLKDALLIARLQKAKRVGVWACAQVMFPDPVAEGEADAAGNVHEPADAPYFPLMLLAVDTAEGMVIAPSAVKPDAEAPLALVTALAGAMSEHGRPRKIQVPDARTHALLSTAMAQLGVQVERCDDLPALEDAMASLYESTSGREGTSEAEIEALLDLMQTAMESGDMPDTMLAQLRSLYDQNLLPAHLADKVGDMLGIHPGKKATIQQLPTARAQSFVISVSLGKGCYRHIRMDAGDTLETLHKAILAAFAFDDDHLHAFFMDNKAWSQADAYFSKHADTGECHTDACSLQQAGLHPGMAFKYVFDFGEGWTFQCKVLRTVDAGTEAPEILRSVGDAPAQYPDFDEEADEDGEDEESVDLPEVYDAKKLKELYAKLTLPPETQKLLHQYFAAFANLYGILPLRKALDIYTTQNGFLPEADFAAFAEVVRHDKHYYYILGEDDLYDDAPPADPMNREIVAEHLLIDDDDYEDMKYVQRGRPYYIPQRDMLLRYADDSYYEETPAFLSLRDYLRKELKLSAKKAHGIADEVQLFATVGENDLAYVVQEAQRVGAPLDSRAQVEGFLSRYVDLANASRLAALRGFTPNEVDAFRETGRNDPCPCGSGKKFKKCCGREN